MLSACAQRDREVALLLEREIGRALSPERHGELRHWFKIWHDLPVRRPGRIDFSHSVVTIGGLDELDPKLRLALERSLRRLSPWRKGPFLVYGIFIDTEWRSDLKWARLAPHIEPLEGRWVLDVGSGSGYHLFRMGGAGAARVVGLEPMLRYVVQFLVLKRLAGGDLPLDLLPLPLEAFPGRGFFDTVFSMGVLYHRRDPLDHLRRLYHHLRPGGQLVLESLIVEDRDRLVPEKRYAKMRNVWTIPSLPLLERWLLESGFREILPVDVTPTTTREQRPTDWMGFHSLPHFLDPQDPSRTAEGYPAPRRAIVLAYR